MEPLNLLWIMMDLISVTEKNLLEVYEHGIWKNMSEVVALYVQTV